MTSTLTEPWMQSEPPPERGLARRRPVDDTTGLFIGMDLAGRGEHAIGLDRKPKQRSDKIGLACWEMRARRRPETGKRKHEQKSKIPASIRESPDDAIVPGYNSRPCDCSAPDAGWPSAPGSWFTAPASSIGAIRNGHRQTRALRISGHGERPER